MNAPATDTKESPRFNSKVAMDRMTQELHGEQAEANARKKVEEDEKKNRHKEFLEENLICQSDEINGQYLKACPSLR